jgi:hypothetical protein
MGTKMISACLEKSNSRGNARLIAILLALYADDTGYTYRSIPKLARQAGIDERTAQRAIRKLELIGEVRVSIATGPRGSNEYWLVWGQPALGAISFPRQSVTPDDLDPRQSVQKTPGNLPPDSTTDSEDISPEILRRFLSPNSAAHRLLTSPPESPEVTQVSRNPMAPT